MLIVSSLEFEFGVANIFSFLVFRVDCGFVYDSFCAAFIFDRLVCCDSYMYAQCSRGVLVAVLFYCVSELFSPCSQ